MNTLVSTGLILLSSESVADAGMKRLFDLDFQLLHDTVLDHCDLFPVPDRFQQIVQSCQKNDAGQTKQNCGRY